MLATEFGGMNEVLADLYSDTGDVRWLKLAEKFHHNAIVDPLEKERDILPGVHGNTQVPKLYGELAFAQPGQTERDFNQQGEDSSPLQLEGHFGRHGTKWFSFDLPVETNHPMTLVVTYSNDNWRHTSCEVLVDGQKVGEKAGEHRSPEQQIRFTDVEYPIATDLLKDKKKVTVRFEAKNGEAIPGVFGIRMVRADAER